MPVINAITVATSSGCSGVYVLLHDTKTASKSAAFGKIAISFKNGCAESECANCRVQNVSLNGILKQQKALI